MVMTADQKKSLQKCLKRLEIFLLIFVILAVSSLFLMPTIFYALPPISLSLLVGYVASYSLDVSYGMGIIILTVLL